MKKQKVQELLQRQKLTQILDEDNGFWDDDDLKVVEEKEVQGVQILSKVEDQRYMHSNNEPISPYFQNESNIETNFDYQNQNGYSQFQLPLSSSPNNEVQSNVLYNQSFNNQPNYVNAFNNTSTNQYNQPEYSGLNMNLLSGNNKSGNNY